MNFLKMSDNEVECPKCLTAGEVFNGRYIKKCDLCLGEGTVSKEISQSFIDESLYDEF